MNAEQRWIRRRARQRAAVHLMGDRGRFLLPPVGEFYTVETPQGLVLIFVSGWNDADLETAKTLFDLVGPTIHFG